MTDYLFFDLIRVSLGVQEELSRKPSSKEWAVMYDMATKQSLVGVCFVGVQMLCNSDAEDYFGMSEILYFTWMGVAAQIQQKNETINRQCAEIQAILSSDGMRSCILKGQGVAQLYGEQLAGFRQAGDIDIYVDCGFKRALAYAREKYGDVEYDFINAHVPVYKDTDVELHWRVQALANLFKNIRLQKWLKDNEDMLFTENIGVEDSGERLEFTTPSIEFNAFYILLHCYHHMFESGLGLRQLMDYYFVLREYNKTSGSNDLSLVFKQFGMGRFASSVMWIMQYVFGLEDKCLLCKSNEKKGRFILMEILQNGNFGHYDERKIKVKSRIVQPFVTRIQHNWHLATLYPSEFFWAPVWLVYHFVWKRYIKK